METKEHYAIIVMLLLQALIILGLVTCHDILIFYNATNIFSKIEEPTSNVALVEICNVQKFLRQEMQNSNEFVRNMVVKMQAKFNKYWSEIEDSTLLFVIGTVLDLRYKLMFVTYAFMELYGHETSLYITRIKQALYDLFDAYSCQLASSRTNE
ncbi:hypothetical protein Taro_018377, partial [Colocasia esculenta]|nr:hypothetical protein [Colocasia esculenta]